MELLMILHPENEIGGNISTGHTAVFWHSPQHSMDSVPKIIYFIHDIHGILWNMVEYRGTFLRILHPGNETRKLSTCLTYCNILAYSTTFNGF